MSSKIDWTNLKVTENQANTTLRDSVNKFYEHEMNDSSVSQQEALQNTATMTEGYLNYMENFRQAQNTEDGMLVESETVSSVQSTMDGGVAEGATTNGTSNGIDTGGGIDGGVDGGMGM